MSRQMKASTAALEAIANASRERSSIILFNLPEMRFTEEAKIFRQAKARAALAAAGITLNTSDAAATSAVTAATTIGPAVHEIIDDEDWERPPPPPPEAPPVWAVPGPSTAGAVGPVGPAVAVVPPSAPASTAPVAVEAADSDPQPRAPVPAAAAMCGPGRTPSRDRPSAYGQAAKPKKRSRGTEAQRRKAAVATKRLNAALGTTVPLSDSGSEASPGAPPRLEDLSSESSFATDSDGA